MKSKQLLIIVEGEEKVYEKTQNRTENNRINNIYSKKNSSLSSGIIALIVIILAIVCISIGLIIIFRKKLFKRNALRKYRNEYSESYTDLKISNTN